MNKFMSRCLAAALSLLLCLSLLPTTAFAMGTQCPRCHHNTYEYTYYGATCQSPAQGGYACSDCKYSVLYTYGTKLGSHNYVDGECTVCGEKDPDYVAPVEPEKPVCTGKAGCTAETHKGTCPENPINKCSGIATCTAAIHSADCRSLLYK